MEQSPTIQAAKTIECSPYPHPTENKKSVFRHNLLYTVSEHTSPSYSLIIHPPNKQCHSFLYTIYIL